MAFQYLFAGTKRYPFRQGSLFLGTDPATGDEIGIQTERHAITTAGARSGKGVALIIPNLLRWPESALIIDPKGEAAEATAERRKAMGIDSHVIDPFGAAAVPDSLRASFNPVAALDPNSLTIKEDIEAISDGIVMRSDPSASHWDDGAAAIISGLIAYTLLRLEPASQNLVEVRAILRNRDRFAEVVEEMGNLQGCAGLCEAGASAAYAKEGGYFVSNAEKNTRWLDSEGIKKALQISTFSLSDLKLGKASVYLVLPANYLGQHGRFLRLFVRCAIEEMARRTPSGALKGTSCLFILDEFYSLGYIDEIAKAAGLMPGYGVHLWPFLQDLGQLTSLYGREGAGTFFGNSDAHIFFGSTDPETLDFISARVGQVMTGDIPTPPTKQQMKMGFWDSLRFDQKPYGQTFDEQQKLEAHNIAEENRMREYQKEASALGRPRLSPDQVRDLIAKRDGDTVARSMVVFAKGSDVLNLNLAPYFLSSYSPPVVKTKEQKEQETAEMLGAVKRNQTARRALVARYRALLEHFNHSPTVTICRRCLSIIPYEPPRFSLRKRRGFIDCSSCGVQADIHHWDGQTYRPMSNLSKVWQD